MANQTVTEPLTVVVWKWKSPAERAKGAESEFKAAYVNILASSIARFYRHPHRFVCVTDEPDGLQCETMPCPASTVAHAKLGAPKGVRFPSSYRRLWNFSADARDAFGPRILALDIDVIVTADISPLVNRTDDFVTWWDCTHRWGKVPGGIYLHRTGTLTHLWTEFDPDRSPGIAARTTSKSPCGEALCRGSDQGWMSARLLAPHKWATGPHPLAHWTRDDGVWSAKWLGTRSSRPPKGCRIISTPGFDKPWTPKFQKAHPWVCEYWCQHERKAA